MLEPIWVLIISFFVLLLMGFPLAFNMGITSIIYFILTNRSLLTLPHRMFTGITIYTGLAIPLFILMGKIMNKTEITNRIVDFAGALVGHFRGGLAQINVVDSMLFGGCTGSALSDVAGLGSLMIPAMEKEGYDRGFSATVTAVTALQGPIIPPSVPMVLFGAMASVSIGGLLVGGLVPGILLGLSDMVVVYFMAKKRNFPVKYDHFSFARLWSTFKGCFLPLLTPIILLGGILTGVFTPTEASAVAVAYALAMGIFYGKLNLKDFVTMLMESAETAAMIFILAGTANVFGWILAIEKFPEFLVRFITGITTNKYLILMIINIVLLIWGCFMDSLPAILLMGPVLVPLVKSVGINPIHFGVVMVVNLMIGLVTPPYGPALFTAAVVGDISIEEICKALWPFLIANIAVLLLITYVPELVLFIPRLFGLV